MKQQILDALAQHPDGHAHGVPMTEVFALMKLTDADKGEFMSAWGELRHRGFLVRTSRGFKAGASSFGPGGWRR